MDSYIRCVNSYIKPFFKGLTDLIGGWVSVVLFYGIGVRMGLRKDANYRLAFVSILTIGFVDASILIVKLHLDDLSTVTCLRLQL